MYNPGTFRQEKERMRTENEANRTGEQKKEAEQIRQRRADYDLLPNGVKAEMEELEVFNAFAEVAAEAKIDACSGLNKVAPEPDIYCTRSGVGHYFELGEIIDQSVAKSLGVAIKHDKCTGGAFSQDLPIAYIILKKSSKSYQTRGVPVDLLLYYRTQSPPPSSLLSALLHHNTPALRALVTGMKFQGVWIFDFTKRRILWKS